MEYQSSLPYPEVKVERKNLELAYILTLPYSGNISEETAVHLYTYESFIFKEYEEIFKQISIVEMHHLELLAETIKLLGLDPKFETNNLGDIQVWASNNVRYTNNLEEALKINIESENKAINNYKKIIEISSDKYVNELLDRIILDEQIHLTIFNNLLEKTRQ